jgi:DNA-binding Lrp family transcriptional regulator
MISEIKDLEIICNLRENARSQLKEIGHRVGMPVSTVFEKMKALKSNYIRKFTCILDYDKLGYPVRAKILIRTRKEDRQALTHFLVASGSVNSVFKINNGYDFIVEGIFKSIFEVEAFLEQMYSKHKVKTEVFYVVQNIKEEGFLANRLLLKT